ncbi:MAG TPA: hypothetical protein VKM72_12960 [Thermoanaerobaculia bacterium]|nr:hypothetical protein [Thermoanaerobaculia bacterium]
MDHALPVPRWIAAVALTLAAALALPAPGLAQAQRNGPLPTPLPLFPPDNWWNVDISAAPLDTNSTNFINFIGATVGLHPDFGGDVDPDDPSNPETYGFPYASVAATQPLVPVFWTAYGNQSDDGFPGRPIGYPIPPEAKTQAKWIEAGYPGNVDPGGDRHMVIVDRDNRILYELYRTFWNAVDNRWEADSGAIFSLDSNYRRTEGWTSADAAGLAIFPGLIRYDEAFGTGPIKHAFRVTVDFTKGHVYPASHTASTSTNANALPMGARLRLKASKNISGYAPEIQRIFQAMKTYGLIVADNGSDMYIQGTYDTRWSNDVLNPAFSSLKASDFEVIQLGWKPTYPGPVGPLDFYTLSPCRLLDTRQPYGTTGGPALPITVPRVVVVTGLCGIPPGAKAIAVNVTVISPPGPGYVRLYMGNSDPTTTSTVNFGAGEIRSNNAILPLATSGSGALSLQSSTAGVHVAVDVMGYFL